MLKIEKLSETNVWFMEEFKAKEGKVITEDDEKEEKVELHNNKATIKFIPLWEWLLQSGKKFNTNE